MRLGRANFLLLAMALAFLLPLAMPGVGLDYQYFFIAVIVLFAWFLIKWESVKKIELKSSLFEKLLAIAGMGSIYVYKYASQSPVGILNLFILFVGAVVLTYGVRSMRLFWVPAAYGVVLLAGYQIEIYTPNFVALQNWLAGVLAASVNALGIGATVNGQLVTMSTPGGVLLLDVASECTGLQGILAFGLLSTMALIDLKPRIVKLIPIFALGFLGAFLINILRLLVVFLTFEYLGVDAGTTMHVYFGYLIFIAWVLVFWAFAFRWLGPPRGALTASAPVSPSAPQARTVD